MVWSTCLMFFQACLLAGYACADRAQRWLGVRWQAVTCVLLVLLGCWSLPISASPSDLPATGPGQAIWLLGSLASAIGLPFVALAACTPSLQRWFSLSGHPAAADPYFLYVASNVGSLFALVSYPVLVEPVLPLGLQRSLWAAGYVAFAVLLAASAAMLWRVSPRHLPPVAIAAGEPASIGRTWWRRRLRWTLLAVVPSSLLLAVTTYASTDLAAVPLLWIIPLSIYLLTFIAAFGSRSAAWTAAASLGLPFLVTLLLVLMAGGVAGPLWAVVPFHLLTFGVAAMACHGRLAAERPGPSELTDYYFWLALGGALGGLLNTLLAPVLFGSVVEYPLALLAAAALAGRVDAGAAPRSMTAWDLVVPMGVAAFTAALLVAVEWVDIDPLRLPALGLAALLAFSQVARPGRFVASLGAMVAAAALTWDPYGDVLHTERTFFGVYRVTASADGGKRSLYHGTTLHGVHALEGPDRDEPLTYYHRDGPFGQAFEALPVMRQSPRVVAIGLGVGSLAAYAGAGQRWTFLEIDPAVERIARRPEYFRHLDRCGARCEVVLGDARLSLAARPGERYGLVVLDAFNSDAIPMHLVTREAVALYLSRLTPDGVLAFHVSNRHLVLGPVLANLAADARLFAAEQVHLVTRAEAETGRTGSDWVVMSKDRGAIDRLLADERWVRLTPQPSAPLWTDDFSNILSVLRP
jgi:hypothetical protein